MISPFLERIRMEDIEMKNSLVSELQIDSICSIRIRSRNGDIFEKRANLPYYQRVIFPLPRTHAPRYYAANWLYCQSSFSTSHHTLTIYPLHHDNKQL